MYPTSAEAEAGVSWHGNEGLMAKNPFKLEGALSSPAIKLVSIAASETVNHPYLYCIAGLSSLTYHGTRLNISFPHRLEPFQKPFTYAAVSFAACSRHNVEEPPPPPKTQQQQQTNKQLYWMNWRDLLNTNK